MDYEPESAEFYAALAKEHARYLPAGGCSMRATVYAASAYAASASSCAAAASAFTAIFSVATTASDDPTNTLIFCFDHHQSGLCVRRDASVA